MSTNNKNTNNHDVSVNQSSPTSSSISNYKRWLVSFGLIVLIAFLAQRRIVNKTNEIKIERLFTVDELQAYTKDELYLAILGHVFNVSSAPKFYGSKGSYRYYTGRDASRSFHTGGIEPEDLTDDLTGFDDEAVAGIHDWLLFYKKSYPEIGRLIGRYFDSNGIPTKHFNDILIAVENMKKRDEEKTRFENQWPPCNSEWSRDTGRRVWCTEKSGGIERSWTGFPRRYFDSTTKTERCVCVQNKDEQSGRFKEYENCLPTNTECKILD